MRIRLAKLLYYIYSKYRTRSFFVVIAIYAAGVVMGIITQYDPPYWVISATVMMVYMTCMILYDSVDRHKDVKK